MFLPVRSDNCSCIAPDLLAFIKNSRDKAPACTRLVVRPARVGALVDCMMRRLCVLPLCNRYGASLSQAKVPSRENSEALSLTKSSMLVLAVDLILERAIEDIGDFVARMRVPAERRSWGEINAHLHDLASGASEIVPMNLGAPDSFLSMGQSHCQTAGGEQCGCGENSFRFMQLPFVLPKTNGRIRCIYSNPGVRRVHGGLRSPVRWSAGNPPSSWRRILGALPERSGPCPPYSQ